MHAVGRNRRISAQSCNVQHSLLPWPRFSRKLVNFQSPRSGQYSVADDTREALADRYTHTARVKATVLVRSAVSTEWPSVQLDEQFSR
jgi:hypothetical protein